MEIPIKYKNQTIITLIDDDDFEKIKNYKLNIKHSHSNTFYVYMKFPQKRSPYPIARFIMKAEKGKVVDHINNNSLDNRKINLRVVSHKINSLNRRGPRKDSKTGIRNVGIYKLKNGTTFYQVVFNKTLYGQCICVYTRLFDNLEDAKMDADKMRIELEPKEWNELVKLKEIVKSSEKV